MRFKKFYMTEKVYGKNAIVYHRTGSKTDYVDKDTITNFLKGSEENILARIKKDGMKTGNGDMYGKGIYTTYSLNTQLSYSMSSTYGHIIIKLKANLNEVLIFDYDVSKIINGKNYTLVDQLNKFGLNEIATKFSNESEELEKLKYTSDIALKLSRFPQVLKKTKGILFTGRRDGNVLVIYDTKAIVPMSINTTIDNPNKLDRKEWIDIKNKNLIKQAIDIQTTTIDKQRRDKLRNLQSYLRKLQPYITNIDMKKLIDDYPWFVDNFISGQNIDIEITKEGLQLNAGTLKMKEVDDENFRVAKDSKLYCDVWEMGVVKDKAEVKCKEWKNGNLFNNAKVKCKEWKEGWVEDNAKVECDVWEYGSLFNEAEVKCKEWKDGLVFENAKVECDVWKEGSVRNESKVECKKWQGGSVKDKAKVKCKEWKKGWVKDNAKVKCNVWEKGSVDNKAEVECDVWENGSLFNEAEVKCKEWENGLVYHKAKVECDLWKDGEVKDKAEVKCNVWKDGGVKDNTKVECDVWENGWVEDEAKVECKEWKNGSVNDNAKVYIKGKLKTSNDV